MEIIEKITKISKSTAERYADMMEKYLKVSSTPPSGWDIDNLYRDLWINGRSSADDNHNRTTTTTTGTICPVTTVVASGVLYTPNDNTKYAWRTTTLNTYT